MNDEHLPRLLVVLHNLMQTLQDQEDGANLNEIGLAICVQIEQWEQELVTQCKGIDPSVTREKLINSCRHAPTLALLHALVAQQEALRTLSGHDYHTSLGGLSTEEAAFWKEEGEGYWALEYGKAALASTWWMFHTPIRDWAQSNAASVEQLMEQATHFLSEEATRQQVGGVIEPILEALLTYRQLFHGDAASAHVSRTPKVL